MKNKLVDLNNHLFEQLERLNDDDLSDAELEREMKRSRAMAGIASNIVANAQLAILETEMVTIDQVMIPYFVTKSGSTVYELYENNQLLLEG